MKRVNFPSYDKLIAAAVEIYKKEGERPALVGGLAMQIYGSPRLTQDIDLVSDRVDNIRGEQLSIGGVRTTASNGVETDIIVRDDEWQDLYLAAHADPLRFPELVPGVILRVVRPEFLVSMKIQANRDKDTMDVKYLLTSDILDMSMCEKIARQFLGRIAVQDIRQLKAEAIWEKEKQGKETR